MRTLPPRTSIAGPAAGPAHVWSDRRAFAPLLQLRTPPARAAAAAPILAAVA